MTKLKISSFRLQTHSAKLIGIFLRIPFIIEIKILVKRPIYRTLGTNWLIQVYPCYIHLFQWSVFKLNDVFDIKMGKSTLNDWI